MGVPLPGNDPHWLDPASAVIVGARLRLRNDPPFHCIGSQHNITVLKTSGKYNGANSVANARMKSP
eukprot:51887-Pyramimonas_sp.AAC.1